MAHGYDVRPINSFGLKWQKAKEREREEKNKEEEDKFQKHKGNHEL